MLPLHYGKSMSPLQLPTTSCEQFVMDRKVKKPLMEKFRRKRINDSLDALKEFVLKYDHPGRQGLKRQLEKADILERTVDCLKKIGQVSTYSKDSQLAEDQARQDGFSMGFNAATKVVFEYCSTSMPPNWSPFQQQQFQLGLITHMRIAMQQFPSQIWVPRSPKSENSSPSPTLEASSNPRKRPWQPWN